MRGRAKLQKRGLLSVGLLAAGAGFAVAEPVKTVALPAAPTAVAVTPADPSLQIPTDPVAKAAFDMLDKSCSRCHQAGPKLTATKLPKKGFGNVLRLDQLAGDRNRIIPGNPEGSQLYQQIVKKLMPYDVLQDGEFDKPAPTEQEIAALRNWIASLGDQAAAKCSQRGFVEDGAVVDMITNDLKSLDPNRVRHTRYMTLANLYNACASDEEMDTYRAGTIKMLNSLGRSSAVVSLQPIDPGKTILRINLDDLGWATEDWDKVIAAYPYAVKPNTPMFDFAATQTSTTLPYIRADWFTFTASRPPLYDALLKLPNTYQELTKSLNVDVTKNIESGQVKRAAFQKSGVSANNRLIERHNISTGYFWTSYDFAGNKEKQSLFEFPLGPGDGQFAFKHDGGETIYSLPNGFQAYMLNKATGEKLDRGPTSIVLDPARVDHNVTNGISCMGCHDQGIRLARDEVRGQDLEDRRFPREVREKIATLYPPTQDMDKALADDLKRFVDSEVRAGINPNARLHGVEPVNALSNRYEAKLDLALASAEYGLPKEKFIELARGSRELEAQARRLKQDDVPRDQFEGAYKKLVVEVTDDTVIQPTPGVAPAPTAVTKPQTPEVNHTFDLSVTSDKTDYHVDDLPVLTIRAQVDCFLTLISTDAKDNATILVPNKFQTDNKLKGGADFHFPAEDATFQYRLLDPGTETISAVCTTESKAPDGIKHDYDKAAFTNVENYTRSVERAAVTTAEERKQVTFRRIVVEGKKPPKVANVSGVKAPVASAPPPPKPEVATEARAAIKISVK